MEYSQSTYAYDAFGRRILVQDRAEATLRTLYDGLTFDVIKQSPTLANGMFTDSLDTGIHYSRTGRPTGDRYCYISDEEAHFGERYRYIDDNTYKIVNYRYRGERTQISVNGSIAAQATSDDGIQYFSTDLLGSVASVTDNYGNRKAGYSYDAFGSLVNGDLSGSTDFGYLGKQNDTSSRLYNYGYRDYKTQLARFTTVDPIRDGTNWLVYCNGDAVNFVDLWGLSATDRVGDDLYYNSKGEYLKTVTNGTASVYLSENGKTTYVGSQTDFEIMTAALYGETKETSYTLEEMQAIGDVIMNRAEFMKTSASDEIKAPKQVNGYYNNDSQGVTSRGRTSNENERLNTARNATITTMLGTSSGMSNGAYFWDGADIVYNDHNKILGIHYTDSSHDIYGTGDNILEPQNAYNGEGKFTGTWDHMFDSTAAYGGTIFWKKNETFMKVRGEKEFP